MTTMLCEIPIAVSGDVNALKEVERSLLSTTCDGYGVAKKPKTATTKLLGKVYGRHEQYHYFYR